MVKNLILVRHGNPQREGADLLRELTPEAVSVLTSFYPTVFSLLKSRPEDMALWSSPAVRATQTAEIIAKVTGIEDRSIHDSLYDQDLPALLEELDTADAQTLILVGHMPFLGFIVKNVTGVEVPLDKGSVCAMELNGGMSSKNTAACVWREQAEVCQPHGNLLWFVAGPKGQ